MHNDQRQPVSRGQPCGVNTHLPTDAHSGHGQVSAKSTNSNVDVTNSTAAPALAGHGIG